MNRDYLIFALVIVKNDTTGCRGRIRLGVRSGIGSGRQGRGDQLGIAPPLKVDLSDPELDSFKRSQIDCKLCVRLI